MQLVVDKIAKAFGIHEIFKDVSFMVEQGEHVGLVGVNGSGKTTLLRCLLQPEWVDSGAVKFEPGISVGYVQQGFTDIRGTIWQFMQTACPEIGSLRQKLAQLEADSGKLQAKSWTAAWRSTDAYLSATNLLTAIITKTALSVCLSGWAIPRIGGSMMRQR